MVAIYCVCYLSHNLPRYGSVQLSGGRTVDINIHEMRRIFQNTTLESRFLERRAFCFEVPKLVLDYTIIPSFFSPPDHNLHLLFDLVTIWQEAAALNGNRCIRRDGLGPASACFKSQDPEMETLRLDPESPLSEVSYSLRVALYTVCCSLVGAWTLSLLCFFTLRNVIDMFGTWVSSVQYLRQLPDQILSIDLLHKYFTTGRIRTVATRPASIDLDIEV